MKNKRTLEELWFIYGNHGPKHTLRNHKFIQLLIEDRGDKRNFYKPTDECIKAVDEAILKAQ